MPNLPVRIITHQDFTLPIIFPTILHSNKCQVLLLATRTRGKLGTPNEATFGRRNHSLIQLRGGEDSPTANSNCHEQKTDDCTYLVVL